MSDIITRYRRDNLGNIIGVEADVKNDTWTYGGYTRTDHAQLYVQNRLLKTTIDYAPAGLGGTLSGGNDVVNVALGFTTAGQPTGTITGKFGNSSFSIVPDGFTTQYQRVFGQTTLRGTYSSPTNTWGLNFSGSGSSWGYGISTGYSQSGGFSFFGSIFNLGF